MTLRAEPKEVAGALDNSAFWKKEHCQRSCSWPPPAGGVFLSFVGAQSLCSLDESSYMLTELYVLLVSQAR